MEAPPANSKLVTVQRSWPAATLEGAAALVLETEELGTIVVKIPPEAIPLIRENLNALEAMLSHGIGHA